MQRPDEIHISNLELNLRIGVSERERSAPQRLTVSLTLRPRSGFLDLDDRIERAMDYSSVCTFVREATAVAPPRCLIETLAQDIAGLVLTQFTRCENVDVELRKYVRPDTDYVAVRISRSQTGNRP